MIPIGEWLPDRPALDNPGSPHVLNVLPLGSHYAPQRGFSGLTNALDAACQGAMSLQDLNGVVQGYAGDAAKLYELSGGDTWSDASKVGGYNTAQDDFWAFVAFGDLAIAVNGTDTPQKIVPTVGGPFADLLGSPPVAKYAMVVRDHVVLGCLANDRNGIHWSAFNDAEGWTIGTDLSDKQTFPDGGWVRGMVGGEVGYVFTETQIIRMSATGDEFIFQFDVIERNRGLYVPSSLVTVGRTSFFLANDGFYKMVDGVTSPIGAHKVDRSFLADVNSGFLWNISAAADPVNKIVTWAYTSVNSNGPSDKIITFNWVTGQWGQSEVAIDLLYSLLGDGQTLESLDGISASLDALPFSLDSRVWMGGNLVLGAFSTNKTMGALTGATLAAELDTKEAQLGKGRSRIQEVIPHVDAAAATIKVGVRERMADAVSWSDAYAMETTGQCMARDDGRFHRTRLGIPAGTEWTEAQGVDVTAVSLGAR
jgi:hypothetical protein